jgi:integrase
LSALKAFFQWLADRPGYKSTSHMRMQSISIFLKRRREWRRPIVASIRPQSNRFCTCSNQCPRSAFILLTGARDGATASFKLKHIDLVAGKIEQDAREVNTKRSKTFTTCFFPVGDVVREIVVDWVNFLRNEKLWGNDDPLFPATETRNGADRRFEVVGLARKHWSNATAIRNIFKQAFTTAGLPYFNPHSFRNTLAQLAYKLRLGPEQFKVWSQNLGHESVLTTFSSYGEVSAYRQAEIMRNLAETSGDGSHGADVLNAISKLLARNRR